MAERRSKQLHYWNGSRERPSERQMQPQNCSFSFQSSTVTYGGANGAYYTSSMTRRTGSDGVRVSACYSDKLNLWNGLIKWLPCYKTGNI